MKNIFRYLNGTLEYFLLYSNDFNKELVDYSDANCTGDTNEQKSTSGYVFMMADAAISWRSKKKSSVVLSTLEAEYMALSAVVQEALWLKQLLNDFNMTINTIKLYEDNQSAIFMTKNPLYLSRSKHIDIRYHFIKESFNFIIFNIFSNKMIFDIYML